MRIISSFVASLLAVALFATGSAPAAAQRLAPGQCTLILDADSGKALVRDGNCERRLPPASTFKVPLAVLGFETGVLTSATSPMWDYKAEFDAPKRDQKSVNPTIWEQDSVLWYSREVVRLAGADAFASFIKRIDYGSADVSGDPGKNNGLTHSWLSSSLRISADEQAAFMRGLLRDELPVKKQAMALTRETLPRFKAGDWQVTGKTGSIFPKNKNGSYDRERPIGWFVGWAQKGDRKVVFVSVSVGDKRLKEPGGPAERARLLKRLPGLVK